MENPTEWCLTGLAFHARMLITNPWKYSKWRAEAKATEARDKWEAIHSRVQVEIDAANISIVEKTTEAKRYMQQGRKPLAMASLKERQRLRLHVTNRQAQQQKAELFMQQIDGKELEVDMIEATKQSVSIMNQNNDPKQVRKLEELLGEMQNTMDVASDMRQAFGEDLHSGGQIVSDDDLLEELEGELAEMADVQLLTAFTSHDRDAASASALQRQTVPIALPTVPVRTVDEGDDPPSDGAGAAAALVDPPARRVSLLELHGVTAAQ
jgi:hypothetical protein